jgi:hypothetical protein
MVAKVITGKTIRGVLNYNEHKVNEEKAICLAAPGFPLEGHEMNFYDKLRLFEHFTSRNLMVKTNSIHISLNFDISEKFAPEKLLAIAGAYMKGIGFGDQPYLVYEHLDAAHPHLHIVTTNIRDNGQRIDLHNIGRNQSEATRKQIESDFNLVRAESKSKQEKAFIQPIDVQRAIYGKSETKRSISNVVRMVTHNYKYTSLAELNAILLQFNVVADRGKEGTKMFEKKGLVYSLLDSKGERIGIPVKASAIYMKPTLPFLERQFELNQALRQPYKASLKDAIGRALASPNLTKEKFVERLNVQGLYVLFRTNEEGRTYGITFVDNRSKTVFNGSDLGKSYGAKAILERLSFQSKANEHFRPGFSRIISKPSDGKKGNGADLDFTNIVENLFHAETPYMLSPEAALRLRKKRKR